MYKIEKIRRKEVIMKQEIPSRELLEELVSELKTVGNVAASLQKPLATVMAWFTKYKLDFPKYDKGIFNELKKLDFSDVHKSVVLGSILGDGSLVIPKRGKNARLQIKHCTKQKQYLIWKKRLLDPFSRPIYQTSKPGKVVITGIETYSTGTFSTYTVSHPILTDYYHKFYSKGHKRVDELVIKELNLLALGIWIADDGTFYSHPKFNGVCHGKICTNSFYFHEQEILVEAIKKFYGDSGISIMIHNREKKQYVIKLTNSKNCSFLLEQVRSVLPKCIHYKLDPQRLYVKPLT